MVRDKMVNSTELLQTLAGYLFWIKTEMVAIKIFYESLSSFFGGYSF